VSGGQLGPPCSAGEAVLGLQTMSCAHSKLRYCSAAQYGKEVVPLNEDMKRTLGYMPGPKALELFGFVEAARVPLQMGMKARTPLDRAPCQCAWLTRLQRLARGGRKRMVVRCVGGCMQATSLPDGCDFMRHGALLVHVCA